MTRIVRAIAHHISSRVASALSRLMFHEFVGTAVFIHPRSIIRGGVTVGDYTKINGPCFLDAREDARIDIGRYCAIAYNLRIRSTNHDTRFLNLQYALQKRMGGPSITAEDRSVSVKNAVWIGDNVIIVPGVSLGEGSVVGAGSVVTKDTRPYSINVGVPAREVSRRFSDAAIDEILSLDLWSKEPQCLMRYKLAFASNCEATILAELRIAQAS